MRIKRFISFLCVVFLFSTIVNTPLYTKGKNKKLIVSELYQTTSIFDVGVDAENVRLGWKIESTYRNVIQKAYYLQIRDDTNIVYDTGWVDSSLQTGIKAENLKEDTVYYWKVNIKDQKGNESGFSQEHSFETAPKELEGVFIGGDQVKLLRKDFTLEQSINNIERARSYFASASLIETRINGKKVGNLVLSPKKPVADKEIYYNTYDILPYLIEGKNSVGIMVSDVYPMGNSVIGMIKITYKDGTTQVISTNTDWLASNTSPITKTSLFTGEDINLNLMVGWDTNEYSDKSKWKKAEVAGMTIKNGGLDVPSNSGSYKTIPAFKGNYTVEVAVSTPNVFGLLLGNSKPYPVMWQFTNNTIRKHQPGNWDNISVANISPLNLTKGTILSLQIEGNTIKTYVNKKLIDTTNVPDGSTDGSIGFRSAPNESFNIDYIKVTQGNKVIFEDNFDNINSQYWNISIPRIKPAITGTMIIEELKPIDIYELPTKGSKPVYVVDFGKNISGYVRVNAKGKKGKNIALKYSELVNENGEIFANTTFHFPQSSYTFTGNDDVFEPKFFYTGFRYIEVTGFDSMPDKEIFTSCFVSDAVKQIGTFESSNQRLNDIYQLYYRAQRSNMVGNYTDCPQREKQGWTGDASVTKQSASLILNDYTTAEAYMKTMYMNIHDGRPSAIVPHLSGDKSLFEEFDIPWTSAYFTFPYFTYMQTGDPYYIEVAYDTLTEVFEYYKSTDEDNDYIVEYNRYGDWLGYDNQEGLLDRSALTATYFYYCGSLLSEMAKVIGRDHSELDMYLSNMYNAIQTKYQKNNYFSTLTQTANSMALDFGLVPSNRKKDILQVLKNKVKNDESTLRTGVLGTLSLYNAMSEANMHKELLGLTVTDKKCSFGYMLDNGATTMWEYWDKAGETFNSNLTAGRFAVWDSQNHCMMGGGLTNWLYQGLGGITNAKAGYKEIIFRPGIESELSAVNCSIDTLIGKTESVWTYKKGVLDWKITVPVNAHATVIIPIEKAKTIKESGKDIYKKDSNGIEYIGRKDGCYIYKVGSGSYSFHVTESKSSSVITWSLSILVILTLGLVIFIIIKVKKFKVRHMVS